MKKLFCILGLACLSGNLLASELPEQCQQFFNQAESLLDRASEKPGVHPNLLRIRLQISTSKTQITKLDYDTQVKSCDLGLAKLNYIQHQDNSAVE